MTKPITIPLDKATPDQLKKFATETLGLDVSDLKTPAQLRARIATVHDKPDITLVADEQPPETAKPKAKAKGDDEWVSLIINVIEEPGGDEPVPLGVNGVIMWVPRGEPVQIRRPYFEVLEKAVMHVHDPMKDGTMNPVPRLVTKYPYSLLPPGTGRRSTVGKAA